MQLPRLPSSFAGVVDLLATAKNPPTVRKLIEPFKIYENKLRQIYAQEPDNEAVFENHLVPVYQHDVSSLTTKARDLSSESEGERDKYLLTLDKDKRRANGTPATTTHLRDFKKNFDIFSESSLADLQWDNVVAAGSSVVTALLPVDAPHNQSKRALRSYYHEVLAPASDVDLFIYGLDEAQAIEKIKQIEADVRDAILSETTVVRTKNAITIISEYPVRHIQIVLRLYKSISEILTGFDVDCACVAYDGKQVWAAPRALAAFATQENSIDLTRRSPSYENRLSKYAHRGFEVYWPMLDRSKVDPTIYERAFNRVLGLARLLVLEKLPHPQDRDDYLAKRRAERGRPELPWNARFRHQLPGNIKDTQPDDIAEWVEENEISNYNTFAIPYGPRYTPKKIERLLFQQDLLKNAEWNKPKDRETKLHRHPAFFGRVEDVLGDCCGYCPKPESDEDLKAWEEESKIFVSGKISFLQDDPGRQEIGSFRPLTDDDWTEMAYVGNTARLCQAIVDKDLESVIDWFGSEEVDVNQRDHTGRTPLQLAVISSTPEIVHCLIEHNARIVARLYNGLTALHLAAWRGSAEMVKALLDKSAENAQAEESKEEQRKAARRAMAAETSEEATDVEMTQDPDSTPDEMEDFSEDDEMLDEDASSDSGSVDRMTGSFVKVGEAKEPNVDDANDDDPDVYDVDVVAWDAPCSAMHLAILGGHLAVMELLVNEFAADVLLPVKLMSNSIPREPRGAILNLLLPLNLPSGTCKKTVEKLLNLGASPLQADTSGVTALHHTVAMAKVEILKVFRSANPASVSTAINHLVMKERYNGTNVDTPLLSAIRSGSVSTVQELLDMGAKPTISLDDFVRAAKALDHGKNRSMDDLESRYQKSVIQPIIEAARNDDMLDIVLELLKRGANINTITEKSWRLVHEPQYAYDTESSSLLDLIRGRRKALEDFGKTSEKESELKSKKPESLDPDDHYLRGLQPGTYQYWVASQNLEVAKLIQASRAKDYQQVLEAVTSKTPPKPGKKEKEAAIDDLARKYKRVENRLIEEGAKTFSEMHPQIKPGETYDFGRVGNNFNNGKDLVYKTSFKFWGADISPSKQDRYIELFEACFRGDIDSVKRLCLMHDNEQPPLQVSVYDEQGFDPFSISLLKGHQDLANLILDIASAQYEDKKETKHMQYSVLPFDQDDIDESDVESTCDSMEDQPRFYSRLLDDRFTIDDIAALSSTIKSNVKPTDLVNRGGIQLWRLMEGSRGDSLRILRADYELNPNPYVYYHNQNKAWAEFSQCFEDERRRSGFTLWKFAVVRNNVALLKYLLEQEVKYSMSQPEDLLTTLSNREEELRLAIKLGHIQIVDTLIGQRGTLLPLDHLAERSGVVIEETPKYYQGLSVYGQKRKDWAQRDQRANQSKKADDGSPLLYAIVHGGIEAIDYFLSDTPMRRYQDFCASYKQDQRIRALTQSEGGVSGALKSWFSIRNKLILHAALMSWPAGETYRLRYLLEKVPKEYLESRSLTGLTPLHLALALRNWPAFELLLSAGADPRTRDRKGCNILHSLYSTADPSQISILTWVISKLDRDVIAALSVERCSSTEPGSLTPLALFLQGSPHHIKDETKLLDFLLKVSEHRDLFVMDGAGDYPLHVQVRNNNLARAEYLAKQKPELLFLENATGMTPVEVAETRYFQARFCNDVSHRSQRRQDILTRGFDEFIEGSEASSGDCVENIDIDDNLPMDVLVYATLIRIARANPRTRSLVSVLDSSEVARRLAGQQRRKNAEMRRREARGLKSGRWHQYYSRNQNDNFGGDDDEGADTTTDEVSQYLANALLWFNKVPFMVHVEDTIEEVNAGLQKWRAFADGQTTEWRCCEKADLNEPPKGETHKKIATEIDECTFKELTKAEQKKWGY